MTASVIGRRYGRALLELAHEAGQESEVRKGLEELLASWTASPELRGIFENPGVGADQRRAILDAVGAKMSLPTLVTNTLKLLADRRRLRHVPELVEAYLELADADAGGLRAEVTTAGDMPESYFAELQKTLAENLGREVTLVKKQDPALIAGVVTKVGDMVFDGSLRSRLRELEDTMLNAETA